MVERRYLVTGASSGIGAAICRRVAAPNVAIAIHARSNREGAKQVAEAARARGALAVIVDGDLERPESARKIADEALAALGGLDVLVSNAGFADRAQLDELTAERFLRSTAVIQVAFLELVRALRTALVASPHGRIIAIGSFVAHSFRTDAPVFLASAAAKGGVEAMVRGLAVSLAPQGVTVNAVVPGAIEKDRGTHSAMTPEQWRATAARIPLGRLGKPEDIAGAVAYLASPEAAYITGQSLHVDGGLII
jgi:NAD(P)-dependent dehydrogenase (short-subunit alcohol dehydrogenase family)